MKKIFLFFLTLLSVVANAQPLSETATASVITCGAGNDFYTTFGHSAIRITDTAQGIDFVYNYGTFDFDIPNFYWTFARGRLDYCLSRSSMDNFLLTYRCEERAVWEQRLDFTPQQVNNLFLMLEWNYLPENRYYRYDFFRDNCATRVRDMVEAAAGHAEVGYPVPEHPSSYRRMVHRSTAGGRLEWWTIGCDLVLGLPADHRCDVREMMFHPEEMMLLFGQTTLDGGRLTQPAERLLDDSRPPLRRSFPPLVVLSVLLIVVALLTWKGLWPRWADRVLYILAGIVGLFLVFMWVGTDHYCTAWNPNILWASPLLILIAIRLHRSPRWAVWFQLGCFAAAAVWAVVCGVSPAVVLIILTLAVRVASLLRSSARR